MTRPARPFLWCVAVAVAAAPGCSAECSGPGCATSYTTARLSWIPGGALPVESDVWDDATGAWTGTATQGTDWRVRTALGRALLGQRDADQVVATSVRAVQGALNPLSSWTGTPGSRFGHDLLALPSPTTGFDLWVSAPGEDFGTGRVHLFHATDLEARTHDVSTASLSLAGSTPNDQLGTLLVACGDLTGDGVAEVAVGAPLFGQPGGELPWGTPIEPLAGAVFLVRSEAVARRAGTFFPWEVGTTWFAPERGAAAGTAVACDRDLDGDGAIDVLLGAPYAAAGRGRVYVLSGAALPVDGSLDGVPFLEGAAEGDWLGASLATFVLSGDPFVAIGAPGAEQGVGVVHVIRGRELRGRIGPTGTRDLATRARFRSPSGGTGQHFGHTLAIGDLDGDDRDDLIVGTPDAFGPGGNDFDTGALDVWYGRRTWAADEEVPDARILGQDPFQRIGRAVLVTDFDGDGIDDLLLPTRGRTRTR